MNAERTTSGLAKLGGKVTAQTSVRPLTVGDNPNGVQSRPELRQAAGTLCASDGPRSGITRYEKKMELCLENTPKNYCLWFW